MLQAECNGFLITIGRYYSGSTPPHGDDPEEVEVENIEVEDFELALELIGKNVCDHIRNLDKTIKELVKENRGLRKKLTVWHDG